MFLPNEGAGFWPLISMGAILGGTMRSPFTSIVFAFELTHDANVFLPLLVGSVIAHAFTVLTLKRSILTEKVSRRGYHLSREYGVDPLELLYAREVMNSDVVALNEGMTLGEAMLVVRREGRETQRLLPIVDSERRVVGVVPVEELKRKMAEGGEEAPGVRVGALKSERSVEAYTDEPLRIVVHRMAEESVTRMPVVERGTRRLAGMVSLKDLLKARTRHLEEERRRETVLGFGKWGVAPGGGLAPGQR